MAAFTLGEATTMALGRMAPARGPRRAAPRPPHRTGAPERRYSMEAGTFEDLFFAMPVKGEPDRMLRAARAALDAGRRLKRAVRAEARELSTSERALAAMTPFILLPIMAMEPARRSICAGGCWTMRGFRRLAMTTRSGIISSICTSALKATRSPAPGLG